MLMMCAVAYKSRGASAAGGSSVVPLDRAKVLSIVASAFTDACTTAGCADVRVDLKAPQYGVLVEVVPSSGGGQLWCTLAVVPVDMLTVKPRLAMRTLCSGQ